MLTGIGADGTRYKDGCTLASELALKEASPIITLPNDDDPDGEPVRYRLRLFILLLSCDWLAVGDFGPFAGSVSATRPCWKCKWVQTCPCAYLPRADPRRATMKHQEGCPRSTTCRTCNEVMETVLELRELATKPRTKTAMKAVSTSTGVPRYSRDNPPTHPLRPLPSHHARTFHATQRGPSALQHCCKLGRCVHRGPPIATTP